MTTTKAHVLAEARRRYGKAAFVRENQHAPTPAVRAANLARRKTIAVRVGEIDAALKLMGGTAARLLEAARFAVDVDGGPPSLEQLRAAVLAGELQRDLFEERSELRLAQNGIDGHTRRWDVGADLGFALSVRAYGDTLDEVLAMMASRTEAA